MEDDSFTETHVSRVKSVIDQSIAMTETLVVPETDSNVNHFPDKKKFPVFVDSGTSTTSKNSFENFVSPSFSVTTTTSLLESTATASLASPASSSSYPADMKPTVGGGLVDEFKLKLPSREIDANNPSSLAQEESTLTEWLPVGGIKPTKTWSEAPPMIITQEEPSVFDITIRHKIGAGLDNTNSLKPSPTFLSSSATKQPILITSSPSDADQEDVDDFSVVATIISTISSTSATSRLPSSPPALNQALIPTTGRASPVSDSDFSSDTSIPTTPPAIIPSTSSPASPGTETRLGSSHFVMTPDDESEDGSDEVVYGKPLQSNRPIAPSLPEVTVSGVMSTTMQSRGSIHSTKSHPSFYKTPMASVAPVGHPIVIPVDMDEVKPKTGPASTPGPSVITDPGQGSVFIDGRPTHFKIRPVNPTPPTLHVGSGVTVKPGAGDAPRAPPSLPSSSSAAKTPAVRRPPFRPRPVVPLVRIDTCIVGDDTTCDVKLNEKCKTELSISSCQCRPGFGRTTPRGMCYPVMTMAVALRLDKMGENKLTFNRSYLNPNSEEYQLLEYETTQGFNSMFALTRLSKVFMGVKINKFYTASGKLVVNASIELEQNNVTKNSGIKRVVQQELSRVIALRNNNIGDSILSIESSATSLPRVDDVNECQSGELNDCSANAVCHNEFGSFKCVCKKGYEDKFGSDPKKSGRICSSCSPSHCNHRGECHVVDGQKVCKCRGNFIGSTCFYDVEGEIY